MPPRPENQLPGSPFVAEPSAEQTATLPPPRQLKRSRSSGGTPPPKKKSRFWRHFWIGCLVVAALCLVAASVAGYFAYQKGLEYYAKAKTYDISKLDDVNVTSTFYDVNNEELGRIFVEDRIILKPEQIPKTMRQAVMAAEDRRFYEHGAIDYWGILRALRENLGKKAHGVQGGSTIEQQLAKHLIGDFSRTLDRKFLEAFVAMRLEQSLTKDQIMNYYLNRIYFGKGYFGIESAARGYFGKDAMSMTVPECALLAGIIRAPTSSSPRVDIGKAKWRRDATLKQMLEEKFITDEEYSRYIKTPIHILPPKPSGLQSYVMAAAVKEMEQILSIEGTEEMPQGLTVHTNINLRLQRAIEEQMNNKLAELETATPSDPTKTPLQGSALVADVNTGRVLAWIGGRDFSKNQFDHVSMARRENGALLQPLLYTLAFDRMNLHPSSMINASYLDPAVPASADDVALGNPMVDLTKRFLSVQDALALGNKAAATRVGIQLGPRAVGDWLRQVGLDQVHVPEDKPNTFNPDPMTLADISTLYQAMANDGVHRKLKIIRSIESRTGDLMYDDTKPDRDDGKDQVLNTLDCQQMALTLQSSLRTGFARALTRDYGFRSSIAGMPGYSEGYRDAWFVGYTPKLLAGVWIGYDDSRPIGSKDAALKSAVPLWGEIMRESETRLSGGGSFPVPDTLTKVEIDRTSGVLKGLAGLAPAPGDIFVYLKKAQVDQIGTASGSSGQQLTAPKEWSDWLTTMFNQADETGTADDQFLSSDKRTNIIPPLAEYKMPGLRGDILSSDGTVYATTTSEQNLVLGWPAADEATADDDIVKFMRTRLDEVEKTIGVKVDVPDANLVNQYRTLRYQPFLVMENVTPTQVDQIKAAGLEAKGFGFQTAPLRAYPHGPELAHVLGYLSRAQQRNKGKYLSGDIIYDRYKGASGIEQVSDADLTGKDGRFMISTSPDGYARSAAIAEPATYGHNVRLSIDSKWQAATDMALNLKPLDAAVIMDVHTGDVIAMSSHPTFDPNIFVPAISADEWNAVNSNEFIPLLDRSIHAEYPPGSGFKTLTSIAAMNAGVFDPNWTVHCTGYFDLDNSHRMMLPEEQGDVTYYDALTYSYNTYFATLGEKIGRDVLLDTARSLNFGSLTNIVLPGELPGCMPDPEFVKRVHQREFGYGDIALTAIGQGDVLVTPLQMCSFMVALANDGTVYRPRLIKQIENRDGSVVSTTPVETLRTVTFDEKWMPELRKAMINVIDNGTAKTVHRDDMKIAAKTGTAQVGSKDHRRQIAWLSGYFPADNPQYAFSVMVEGQFSDNHGSGIDDGLLGGVDAGKIVKTILDSIYNKKAPGDKTDESTKTADQKPGDSATAPSADKAKPDVSVGGSTSTSNATNDTEVPTTPPHAPGPPKPPGATTEVHHQLPPVEAGPATTP